MMNTFVKFAKNVGLAAILSMTSVFTYTEANAQYGYNVNNNIGYQDFYDELAPYGNWYQDPQYGYVWSPSVGRDFRPYYSNGRWAMTDYGNMWVSNYSWGHIPFHYGRWTYSNYGGWVWIPGNEWAPAWVIWRENGSNYGWAPMGPGMNININLGNAYANNYNYWNFVPFANLYGGNYANFRIGNINININFFSTTRVMNYRNSYQNVNYFGGPRIADVRRVYKNNAPTVYRINEVNTRSNNRIVGNSVNVYAPRVVNTRDSKAAPRTVASIDNNRNNNNSRDIARPSNQDNNSRETRNTTTTTPTRNTNVNTNSRSNDRSANATKATEFNSRSNSNNTVIQRSNVGTSSTGNTRTIDRSSSNNSSRSMDRGNSSSSNAGNSRGGLQTGGR